MNLDLNQRHAIVCGSSQGIGRAIALELAAMGCTVTLMARNPELLEQVRRQLDESANQRHSILVADFSDYSQVKLAIDQFVSAGKTADILINNTGGPPPGPALESKINEYVAAFESHLICNQILTAAIVPGMKAKKFGRIVNVISTSVKQPLDGLGVSNTIRGAVASWAKTLAGELGPFGITVNNVLPGMTHTQRLDLIILRRAEKLGISIEAVTQEMELETPARRFGTASEIAAAAAFLASPAASYINGINLPVDGGRTKCL